MQTNTLGTSRATGATTPFTTDPPARQPRLSADAELAVAERVRNTPAVRQLYQESCAAAAIWRPLHDAFAAIMRPDAYEDAATIRAMWRKKEAAFARFMAAQSAYTDAYCAERIRQIALLGSVWYLRPITQR